MSEQDKAAARRVLEAWNNGELDAFDELFAADAVDHDSQNPFAGERGPGGVKKVASMYRAAFSDTHFTIEQQFADGDYVVTRWTATGTQDGELMGMPATGKAIEISGIGIDRFQDGKIVETWGNWDTLGMMQQLGVIPAPEATHA
jgi:steroid delta-isomerase-like uncharacterized protein